MPDQVYQLKSASIDDCLALRAHFMNLPEVTLWGGEGFHYPLQKHAFLQKLMLPDTQSFVLYRGKQQVGFGQICARFGRHHLARLLILPRFRGQGLSQALLQGLLSLAQGQNKRLEFSLFVFLSNEIAMNSYLKVGFTPAEQPGAVRDDLAFMTLSPAQAQTYLQHHTTTTLQQHNAVTFTKLS